MADILTRLLLNTSEFNANLEGAKKSVNSYQGDVMSMAKNAGAGVMKFAGCIGGAITAGEAFMKVIRGSQTTSDTFDNVINSCTSTVNSFFTALSTGDFTTFQNGIDGIVSRAYAASAALDQLGNTRMAYNYFSSQTQADIAESSLIALDKGLSKDERKVGFSNWDKALNNKKQYSETMKGDALDALIKTVVEGTVLNASDVSLSDFENITKLDLYNPAIRDREKEKLENYFIEYKVRMKDLEKQKIGGGIVDWAFPESDDAKSRKSHNDKIIQHQQELNKHYKESLLYKKILDKWSDEELQNAFNLATEYNKAKEIIAVEEKTYNKALNRFKSEKETKGTKDKTKPLPVKDSIEELDAKLKAWQDKFNKATTQEARSSANVMIEELKNRKETIEFRAKFIVSDEELNKMLPKSIKNDWTKQYNEHKPKTVKKTVSEAEQAAINGMSKLKKEPLFNKKDIDANNDYMESLNGISSIFGSLSGVMDDSSASVLQWGANFLSTIAQAIPAILKMVGVKTTDTIATNANTTSEVANASSKVLSAHAEIPFVGIAMGLAGVASIVAAMASMPKFANGCASVPGSSFVGDKVLAGLNSGEMVLNSGQQSRLFRMLNSGTGTSSSQNINIGFDRVKGTDLLLTINNTLKSQGKKPL